MKHFCLFALLLFSGLAAQAQEKENRDAQGRIVRGPYETNRLFDNIFVGVAGGVNLYFGENDSEGKFGKRLAPALDIHAGKWFTPSVGARVGYAGLQAKGWTAANSIYAKGADGNLFKEKFGVMYLHADAMWNLSNALSGYREDRTWNFVPYAGILYKDYTMKDRYEFTKTYAGEDYTARIDETFHARHKLYALAGVNYFLADNISLGVNGSFGKRQSVQLQFNISF